MKCLNISVNHFRNIEHTDVTFDPEINLFCGNNAQGKTNLLEAIFYGTLGKSFRDSHDANLIQFNQSLFSIDLEYTSDKENARCQKVTIRVADTNKKQLFHNGIAIRKISDFVGDFRTVLFCPDHLSMIKNGPAERREFLDTAISQLYPNYLKSLQKFNKIIKQRNKLLKDAKDQNTSGLKVIRETLDIWSEQLAFECAVISWHRWIYIKKLNEEVKSIFYDMTNGKEIPEIQYDIACGQKILNEIIEKTGFPDETNQEQYQSVRQTFQKEIETVYRNNLLENHDREIGAGVTLFGSHKDDMLVLLNDKEARFYGSQGQQRSLALALKISEGEISKRITGEYPIFLFDDVLSELDSLRRNYLLNSIAGKQVIMTTCEPDIMLDTAVKVWDVVNGSYHEKGHK